MVRVMTGLRVGEKSLLRLCVARPRCIDSLKLRDACVYSHTVIIGSGPKVISQLNSLAIYRCIGAETWLQHIIYDAVVLKF